MSQKRRQGAVLAWALPMVAAFASCTARQAAPPLYRPSLSREEELLAIEAAKRHPIAQPRARSATPEQAPPTLPVASAPATAPPPYPGEPPTDGPSVVPTDSAAVAPVAPPTYYADSPRYAAPGTNYVWAPGYWSWSGRSYVWISGDWLRSRPGNVYVGPRWSRSGYGWGFSAGGWARPGMGTVAFPSYRQPYRPYQSHYNHDDYGRHRFASPSNERHDGRDFRAGPMREQRGGSYRQSYTAPGPARGPGPAPSGPARGAATRGGGSHSMGGGSSGSRATIRIHR